ncbi:mycothiol synthase [Aeromicrobium endophyticum]|uniref:Mycothiol acetyltransferase n=1 Tax=Aeromicrobium endophyticum TaxID=2292704 RepID=A0A371PCU1_9ACTN|nr:mycothiol synthase [Aeromicrobium endophyticum]REK73727.1 mycothiol synthase [Aeromicrobium endophyticum]
MSLVKLADRAAAVDGVAPFNEATLFALRDRVRARVLVHQSDPDGRVIAAAYAAGDAPVEIVVDPDRRREGIGRRILDELLADGEHDFWAHGDLPAAQALAASAGLVAGRTLLALRLTFDGPPASERVSEGVTLRTFTPDDVDQVVAVNARAFAHHPEQGAMDRADMERRMASDWFDADGFFVAERDGRVIGFHWTKVEDSVGEVYVVGIDPDAQGGGLGTALTARGLRHLFERGLPVVDLYVEGDNDPALAVYRKLGFVDHARDTLYVLPPTADERHTHP